MAKKKKHEGGKKHKKTVKVVVAAKTHKKHKGGKRKGRRSITLSKVSGRVYSHKRGGYRRTKRSGSLWHSNPGLGGLVRIPSSQELMAVGIGALALPAINKLVKNLPLPDLMKAGWGGIATELLIGSVASVMTRKFVSGSAGDVVFVLALANGVQKSVRQLSGTVADSLGLADADAMSYYGPGSMGDADAMSYYETGQLSDGGLPTMV
jgi:hypothetical protein